MCVRTEFFLVLPQSDWPRFRDHFCIRIREPMINLALLVLTSAGSSRANCLDSAEYQGFGCILVYYTDFIIPYIF